MTSSFRVFVPKSTAGQTLRFDTRNLTFLQVDPGLLISSIKMTVDFRYTVGGTATTAKPDSIPCVLTGQVTENAYSPSGSQAFATDGYHDIFSVSSSHPATISANGSATGTPIFLPPTEFAAFYGFGHVPIRLDSTARTDLQTSGMWGQSAIFADHHIDLVVNVTLDISTTTRPVPEPSSLCGISIAVIALIRRRSLNRQARN